MSILPANKNSSARKYLLMYWPQVNNSFFSFKPILLTIQGSIPFLLVYKQLCVCMSSFVSVCKYQLFIRFVCYRKNHLL